MTGRHAYEIEDAQGPQAPSFPAFTHEDGSYSPLRGRHLFGSGVDVTVERAHDARAFRMNGYQEKHGHRYSRGGANGNRLPAMGEADVSYTD